MRMPSAEKFFRITRIISPLPRIAHIGIESHRDHDTALVVVNAAPVRRLAARFLVAAQTLPAQAPLAGNQITVIQVVDYMKNRVVIRDLDNLPVGENHLHAFGEPAPFVGAPEIVEHKEAAAQQVLAQGRRLGGGQLPVPHFAGVDPGIVERVVAIVEVHGLLNRPHMNPAQPAQRLGKMPVGARIILCPARAAFAPVARVAPETETRPRMLRIHQPRKYPLGLFIEIGRQFDVVIGLHAG